MTVKPGTKLKNGLHKPLKGFRLPLPFPPYHRKVCVLSTIPSFPPADVGCPTVPKACVLFLCFSVTVTWLACLPPSLPAPPPLLQPSQFGGTLSFSSSPSSFTKSYTRRHTLSPLGRKEETKSSAPCSEDGLGGVAVVVVVECLSRTQLLHNP